MEIRAELDELSKVKDIKMPTTKRERNYLTNARLWFRYRCKKIDHIKATNHNVNK